MDPTLARLPLPPSSGGLTQTGIAPINSPRDIGAAKVRRQHWYRVIGSMSSQKPKATKRFALMMLASNAILGDQRRPLVVARRTGDRRTGSTEGLGRIKITPMPKGRVGQPARLPLLNRGQG